MRPLLALSFLLKICLGLGSPQSSENWVNHAKYCLQQEASNNSVLIITNNVTENDLKLIDSAASLMMQTLPLVVLDLTAVSDLEEDDPEVSNKKAAFNKILKINSIIVYFSRSDKSSAKLRDFYASIADAGDFPKVLSIDLDSEYVEDLNEKVLQYGVQVALKSRCFQDYEYPEEDNEIIAKLSPTSYIDFKNDQLQGPEGKIMQALIESVNAKVSITKSESSNVRSAESSGVGMYLNLKPYNESQKYHWSMVYHPYRKLGLIPASGQGYMRGHRLVEYCLLASVTIMIILLLYIMRKLMSIHREDSTIMSAIEKVLFFALILIFFVNIGVLLNALWREKYGAERPDDRSYRYSELPQNECLQEIIKKRNVFCIVDEDFGREAVRRYGKDGKENVIKLVTDMSFHTEWRGIYFTSPVYVEKFNRMQLRFIESGMLEKWYSDELLSITDEEDKEIKYHLGFTKMFKQQERSRKFAFYLNVIMADGLFMAFLMFIGEWLIFGVKSTDKRNLYIYFD